MSNQNSTSGKISPPKETWWIRNNRNYPLIMDIPALNPIAPNAYFDALSKDGVTANRLSSSVSFRNYVSNRDIIDYGYLHTHDEFVLKTEIDSLISNSGSISDFIEAFQENGGVFPSGSGESGSSGTSGSSGISGSSGTSGMSGTSGSSGAAGSSGTSGSSGVNGSSGSSGISGTNNQYVRYFFEEDWDENLDFHYYTISIDPSSHGQGERNDIIVFVYEENGDVSSGSDKAYSRVDVYSYVSSSGNVTLESAVKFNGFVIVGIIGAGLQGESGTSGVSGSSGTSGVNGSSGTSGSSFSVDAQGPYSYLCNYVDEPAGFSFLDTDNGLLYFRNDTYFDPSNLENPSVCDEFWFSPIYFGKGDDGSSGTSGTSGSSGTRGTSGSSGVNGTSGSSGTSGTSGSSGTSGTSGSSGTRGTSGSSGTSGTSGSSGTRGTSGSSGTSGISGDIITASNVGTGGGSFFKQKDGQNLEFRKLKAGANVTISTGVDDVSISASGTGGGDVTELGTYNITRVDGLIDSITTPSKTWTISRDGDDYISSMTDGTNIYTFTRTDGYISSFQITEV